MLINAAKDGLWISFQIYKDFQNFGRDSSQSVGKYSYDNGLWLGPGPEPIYAVPDAPYYRPPTVEQIASTPRPVTAVVRGYYFQFWYILS